MVTHLATLSEGSVARLIGLTGDGPFRRRLMELGLLPGTAVRVVRRSGIGGVLEIEVRNCRLTLRYGEAQSLLVLDAACS